MNATMVQCISCEYFTLKPRQVTRTNAELVNQDRAYGPDGIGRCTRPEALDEWRSAISDRTCHNYAPMAAELVQNRRTWLEAQRKQSQN